MIPWFQWNTISLGPLTIQVWGLFVALGMVLAFFLIGRRSVLYKVDKEDILTQSLIVIVVGSPTFGKIGSVFNEAMFNSADLLMILIEKSSFFVNSVPLSDLYFNSVPIMYSPGVASFEVLML